MPSFIRASSLSTKTRRPAVSLALVAAMLLVSLPGGPGRAPALAQDAASPAASADTAAANTAPDARLNTTNLHFSGSSADAQQFTVTGPAADGRLVATSTNPKVAAVEALPSPATAPGVQTFMVTPTGAGSTLILIMNPVGNRLVMGVDVGPPLAATKIGGTSLGLILGIGALAAIFAAVGTRSGGGSSSSNAPTAPPGGSTPPPGGSTPPPGGSTPPPGGSTPPPGGSTPPPGGTTPPPGGTTPPPGGSTPTPGPLTASPKQFGFVVGQMPTTGTFTVSESGYTGTFTASTQNAAVATVSPGSGTGPNATFAVMAQQGGTTTILVRDGRGNQAAVTVQVTQTNATVQSARRADPGAPALRPVPGPRGGR